MTYRLIKPAPTSTGGRSASLRHGLPALRSSTATATPSRERPGSRGLLPRLCGQYPVTDMWDRRFQPDGVNVAACMLHNWTGGDRPRRASRQSCSTAGQKALRDWHHPTCGFTECCCDLVDRPRRQQPLRPTFLRLAVLRLPNTVLPLGALSRSRYHALGRFAILFIPPGTVVIPVMRPPSSSVRAAAVPEGHPCVVDHDRKRQARHRHRLPAHGQGVHCIQLFPLTSTSRRAGQGASRRGREWPQEAHDD